MKTMGWKMMKLRLCGLLLFGGVGFCLAGQPVEIVVPASDPILFAKGDLEAAIKEAVDTQGIEKIAVSVGTDAPAAPESYQIVRSGNQVKIIGRDETGAMYGTLQVAEKLKLGLRVSDETGTPYLSLRGIKFNLPLDARNPSYDDSGHAAQENVKNMWDLEGFWKPYLDELARNRYNHLSLWTTGTFPHMVDFSGSDWSDVNATYATGVYRVKDTPALMNPNTANGKYIVSTKRLNKKNGIYYEQGWLDTNETAPPEWLDNKGRPITGDGHVDMDKLQRVDGRDGIPLFDTIEKKVNHWKAVFEYAEKRGIDISILHWNVYAHGAHGVDGITESQDDAEFIRYLRYAVKQLILTYPQITTVGVAAGENDNEDHHPVNTTEDFIYMSYGQGVKDALNELHQSGSDRKIKFVWRNHSTQVEWVKERFTDKYDPEGYTGGAPLVAVSIKYTVGRLYASRRPMEWEGRAEDWLDKKKTGGYPYKIWCNIRNDDLFMHRWGSADFVRLFIRNMPREYTPGYVMGSDGYVWGRVFYSTVPELQGQLEIKKHWYNFALWGLLAYNNADDGYDDAYWKKRLAYRYKLSPADADRLFNAWEDVSEIVPLVSRQTYTGTDAGWQPEGCMYRFSSATGFLTFSRLFLNQDTGVYSRYPLQLPPDKSIVGEERQCWPVRQWVDQGKPDLPANDQISPEDVAAKLDEYAEAVTGGSALATLRNASRDVEYQDLLLDLESMAQLGHYYADKLRCAISWYAFWKSNQTDTRLHKDAIADIENAEAHWMEYAKILSRHYKPTVTARTHFLDWENTLNNGSISYGAPKGVKLETKRVREIDSEYDIKLNPAPRRWERWQGEKQTPPWKQ